MSYITEIRMQNLKVGSWQRSINQLLIVDVKAVYPAISGHGHDSFGKVISRLAATRIHRLFMVDDRRMLTGCFTLYDVLRTLMENLDDK